MASMKNFEDIKKSVSAQSLGINSDAGRVTFREAYEKFDPETGKHSSTTAGVIHKSTK